MMTQKARPDDGKRTICCWARQILYCRLVRLRYRVILRKNRFPETGVN
jgi:hypothetical protein